MTHKWAYDESNTQLVAGYGVCGLGGRTAKDWEQVDCHTCLSRRPEAVLHAGIGLRETECGIGWVDLMRMGEHHVNGDWDNVTCAACLAHRPPARRMLAMPDADAPLPAPLPPPPARCKPGCWPGKPCMSGGQCPAWHEAYRGNGKGIDADPKPRRFDAPELRCDSMVCGLYRGTR